MRLTTGSGGDSAGKTEVRTHEHRKVLLVRHRLLKGTGEVIQDTMGRQ